MKTIPTPPTQDEGGLAFQADVSTAGRPPTLEAPARVQGYYSLIQYEPCPARAERMNVGVILLCEALHYLDAATLKGRQLMDIVDQFPRTPMDWEALDLSLDSLTLRVASLPTDLPEGYSVLKALDEYIQRRCNNLRVTERRSIAIDHEPAEALSKIFQELVDISRGSQTPTTCFAPLNASIGSMQP